MKLKTYRLSSFSQTVDGGNPAGVVLNADSLDEKSMLEISSKIGYSETAFVSQSKVADYKVRFFTPVKEVDLCGHATIATFNLLRDLHILPCGEYIQETKAGILKIIVNDNDVFMEQNKPVFFDIISLEEINKCFESSLTNIDNQPIQIVSTGMRDIMLPVKNLGILNELLPKFNEIIMLSNKYDVSGIHVFTQEGITDANAVCRNFAPRDGINEESATGTSNGALACYLNRYSNDTNSRYLFKQGYSMNKPSEIKVELGYNNENIDKVYVGGNAVRIEG
ncbi:PhzF family phenazine biosynthesis protein [Vallitalea maricola]|uniref:PhzF family phenazine biosynthesis protein n=1 Tax=Vallitalea maricola TaxID=3074433 RepID=A0ACB5UKT8_9FIRM|nr:PhzF family phenazine biosynthesis protein [Vallitalea sp. AN17-2]